jgi:Glycosyltransferase family 87
MEHSVQTREELIADLSGNGTRCFNAKTLGFGFFVLCLVLVVVAYAFTRPLEDFVAYWTAAHLLVSHQNPYSLGEVFRFQQSLGWREPIPLVALNPPWTLPFFAPLGLTHSYALAWLGWVAVMTCAIAISSRMLMDIYFRDVRLPEISDATIYRCLFAFTFYPVLLSLKFAQTVPVVLLGTAAFLFYEEKRRPILAGALFGLTAVKPNLVYLVWLALLLRSIHERRWKTLTAAAGVITSLTAVALLMDPHAIGQYRALASSPLPRVLMPGMAGAVRSLFGGRDLFWLQFLPPVAGLSWFALYWRKHRSNWSWIDRMPALVTASLLTTSWGYMFDQTLLAIPIIALAGAHAQVFGRLPRNLVILYTALNVTLILLAMASSPWSFVPAPIIVAFLLYREARSGNSLSAGVHYSYVGSQL